VHPQPKLTTLEFLPSEDFSNKNSLNTTFTQFAKNTFPTSKFTQNITPSQRQSRIKASSGQKIIHGNKSVLNKPNFLNSQTIPRNRLKTALLPRRTKTHNTSYSVQYPKIVSLVVSEPKVNKNINIFAPPRTPRSVALKSFMTEIRINTEKIFTEKRYRKIAELLNKQKLLFNGKYRSISLGRNRENTHKISILKISKNHNCTIKEKPKKAIFSNKLLNRFLRNTPTKSSILANSIDSDLFRKNWLPKYPIL